MFIRQLFDHDTYTYTYLIADEETGKAVLIDPVLEQVERDMNLVKELGLELVYVLDTHAHADHVTASGSIRDRTGVKTVLSDHAGATCVDCAVADGDVIEFGSLRLEVRSTPGHTDGCVTYVLEHAGRHYAFTGDALLIRGSGRTDFQAGDARKLYQSVHDKIYSLPDDTLIYPGHDYHGHLWSTVGEEKRNNPRLKIENGVEDFVRIMNELKLAPPKRIDVAVPANLACGKAAV